MTDTSNTRTLELGGQERTVERPTGLKASRALALFRELSKATPELQSELAAFRRQYEADNVIELDRVQAKLRYPPRPIVEAGVAVLDEAGAPRMLPSPVDRLTEEDWQQAGGVYRMPASPSGTEVAAALFDTALERAERTVYRLLALFIIPNGELKQARRAGNDDALLDETAEALLDDAYADELLELAVVISETVDQHFRRKVDAMGPRMGGLLKLIGLEWTPSPSPTSTSAPAPSESKPSSSTDTPASTPDGPPTSSSTPPSTSSSSSESSPASTPSDETSTSSPTATAHPEPAPA